MCLRIRRKGHEGEGWALFLISRDFFLSALELTVKHFLVFHEGVPLWQFHPLEDTLCFPKRHPRVPEAEVDARAPLTFLQVQHQREAHHAPRVPGGRRGAPAPTGTSTLESVCDSGDGGTCIMTPEFLAN